MGYVCRGERVSKIQTLFPILERLKNSTCPYPVCMTQTIIQYLTSRFTFCHSTMWFARKVVASLLDARSVAMHDDGWL